MAMDLIGADSAPVMQFPSAQQACFDAADWMERFERVGGHVSVSPEVESMSIGWQFQGFTSEQQIEAREIFHEIEGDDDRRNSVRFHALELTRWRALLRRLEDLEANRSHETNDADLSLASAIRAQLLATPAPNRAALRWKLDRLLAIDAGRTSSWSAVYVSQTVADYQRILGETCRG